MQQLVGKRIAEPDVSRRGRERGQVRGETIQTVLRVVATNRNIVHRPALGDQEVLQKTCVSGDIRPIEGGVGERTAAPKTLRDRGSHHNDGVVPGRHRQIEFSA